MDALQKLDFSPLSCKAGGDARTDPSFQHPTEGKGRGQLAGFMLKVLVILVVSFKILPVTKALQCLCSNLYIYSSFLFLFFCSASNKKHPFLTLAQFC